MSTGYQITNPYGIYFLTFTVVDWVDVFSAKAYRDVLMESFDFCIRTKGLRVYAYVIMTNHVHCILQSQSEIPLSDIIRDYKKFTSRKIINMIESETESREEWLLHRFRWNASSNQRNSIHQLWQHHNHAEDIFTCDFFLQKINYIHNNPVKAGWVSFSEDYVYSSAFELAGRGNKIPITFWD